MLPIKKRTFLITGATKGIGKATALYLSKLGHDVVGIARNLPEASFPGKIYSLDLADEHATKEAFAQINQEHQIDGIVNNVGIAIPHLLQEIKLQDYQSVLDINLRPVIQAMQIFTPRMIQQKWGRVVNIASLAVLGLENRSTYAASKGAMVSFSRSCALELAKTGVTVNVVAPGPTETELYRKHRPAGSEEERISLQKVPMGRPGKPSEVAAAIGFLLSEEAGFITGQTLFVDGGASVGRSLI